MSTTSTYESDLNAFLGGGGFDKFDTSETGVDFDTDVRDVRIELLNNNSTDLESIIIPSDIDVLRDEDTSNANLYQTYLTQNAKLKSLKDVHDTRIASVNNISSTRTYYLLLIWLVILCIVVTALFMNIIESKREMNIFMRFILFVFVLYLLVAIARNFWIYIENRYNNII